MLNEEVTEGTSANDTDAEAVSDTVVSTVMVALSLGTLICEGEGEPLTD